MAFASRPNPLIRPAAVLSTLLAIASLTASPPAAAEPAACLSPDPAQWPEPSKPYFMMATDTSGSMTQNVVPAVANSCGFGATGTQRIDHLRCALRKTIQAFAGQVHMGLTTFNTFLGGCNATCYTPPFVFGPPLSGCGPRLVAGDENFGCGPEPDKSQSYSPDRRGGNILVPMQADDFWNSPAQATNVPTLLSYVDNDCTNNVELYGGGGTSSNGILRDLFRYFSGSWTSTDGTRTFNTPLGTAAQGERSCRSVNIIYMTDGDEDCDTEIINGKSAPEDAAEKLLAGFTLPGDSTVWKVKTHLIRFAGGSQATTDKIAAAGGTGASIFASNEVTLSQALAKIIGGSITPETCDNLDNNCNGCTDEGFKHFCDVQAGGGCCTWKIPAEKTACGANACACCNAANPAERTVCLNNYKATITAVNPQGDTSLLPCTTAAQATDPTAWLCFDPKETCDALDNNCDGQVDEGTARCGNPLHCPSAEMCDGIDNDCDGLVDEGCPQCVPSGEICDGCDNDCDGMTDNGVAPIPCGLVGPTEPPNCAGVLTCKPSQSVPAGTCAPGGGFNPCNNNPLPEVCDGLDNDCNGIPDDNVASVPCGAVPGLIYGGTSQCKLGQTVCSNGVTTCVGVVGPSTEICDGIDNDCDGQVDEGVLGLGQTCGVATPPCTPGTTACVNGAIVCQGGVQPKPEICDGLDNDCDTLIDEAPLADAPGPNLNGCWELAGNCCSFPANPIPGAPPQLKWCAPPGAVCGDTGSLTSPCNNGTLACAGAQGWICTGSKEPTTEACDGIDNDCNGTTDDGSFPGVGQACGPSLPPCSPGVNQCVNGAITCVGGVGPMPETCNGIDDDCNGFIDDGIGAGGPCTVPYDASMYPGDRSNAPCLQGTLACDGMGNFICQGGVGPSPEICDGVDNDCDGNIDEAGNAPDGINGSQNPFPPPPGAIGDACGNALGECKTGAFACVNGTFACIGGQSAVPETCDCKDNDCDGSTDNENDPMLPPLCGQGSSCVNAPDVGCQCAVPCAAGEFPCPVGQKCEQVTSSNTGQPLGKFCVSDACGDCNIAKVKQVGSEDFACAPDGTAPNSDCLKPPVCVCKGQLGCKNPCFGVTCPAGSVCTEYGAKKGTCVADTCYQHPCVGCGKVCNGGFCIDNPCTAASCLPNEECKPSPDFTTFQCIKPCADVMCQSGQVCIDGACVDDCVPPCANGEVCDRSKMPPTCGPDKCNPDPCTDGSFCDPVTGQCGNDPCGAILCPDGSVCKDGQCVPKSASSSSSSSSSSGGGAGAGGNGNGGGGGSSKGVWGLATGGGGCSCEVGPGLASRIGEGRWALAALALGIAAFRRKRRAAGERGRGSEVAR